MKASRSQLVRTRPLRWVALCLALTCGGAMAEQVADVEALEVAAQGGDVQALVALAGRYEYGEGVAQDFARSNELYCRAAKRGDSAALLQLALIYSNGREVQADEGVAALLLSRAAEQGHAHAQELLQHVSRRADTVLPACLSETPVAATAPSDPEIPLSGRKSEIEALVHQLAPRYAIDPELVMAVMATESSFQVNAVSPKNAQGLMQLIPATAERFGVKKVFNPVENLKGGLAYLRWLMAHFEGDVVLVLAAYNAGEEAVAKYRGIPPYAETRNYVRRITRVYRKARHPYLADVVAPSPVLGHLRRAAAGDAES